MRTAIVILAICASGLTIAQDPDPGMKRRDKSSDEDLRKQLLKVKEFGFDQPAAAFLHKLLTEGDNGQPPAPQPNAGHLFYAQLARNNGKLDMTILPWILEPDCSLGKDLAERMHVLSVDLRRHMRAAVPPNDVRPDPDKLSMSMAGERRTEWSSSEAVPTIVQMLQVENSATRQVMVQKLADIKSKAGSVALAQRAVFDLSSDIRAKALEALAKTPQDEIQHVFLEALRYPWPPVADHAAEALVALKLKTLVPELVGLLAEPDPKFPFVPKTGKDKAPVVREMVRMNHMTNCCLCHAISGSKDDLVRGRVPLPGQEMPPEYYQAQTGLFVRADTTYLRQDFSVVQPVENPGKWPNLQRFDYLIRTRKATALEIGQATPKKGKLPDPYPQRESVLFALRELTGQDRGDATEKWFPLLRDPVGKK